ncbi:MAG: sigma 54-interacting transcriptional regulator [Desulfobulbaceae bacterium]|nr:sigma 54-interacting transcriptional regulator [Desulfobulbaceae bacterium]
MEHPPARHPAAPANEDMLLRAISDGTAAETGSDFFRALVRNLSLALGTYGAWVTEYRESTRRLRSLAFWLGDNYIEDYEYDITGTPCEVLLREKTYLHIPENVVELFPGDPDLPKIGAVSYIGFPLLDQQRMILGNLAIVDRRPIPDSFRNLALFRIFAARATAEMLRLRSEAELQDREAKLRGVFDGALDAILELDQHFRIAMLNPAARKLFAISESDPTGRDFEPFLAGGDYARLHSFIQALQDRSKNERSIWIPDGLTVTTRQGKTIRTEATLSQLDTHGPAFYVLILRDVNERYESAQTIALLQGEADYLRSEVQTLAGHGEIIGRSRPLRAIMELIAEVAPTDSTVLLFGETGTGKELLARAIHAASSRKNRPMITVNCAAIPDTLLESEFFGHEKGAFTGATQRREGRFSLADGGTIFLDEIGELNLEMQAKLLRVLQEGEFSPVGSSRNRQVDVRVIAATNRDLLEEVRHGTFRMDLYYRLSVFPITIPPLRDRGDDIALLANGFLEKYATRLGKRIAPLSPRLLQRLRTYCWPGNVRELQNVIERGVITARHGELNLDYALPHPPAGEFDPGRQAAPEAAPPGAILTSSQLQQMERDNLLLALSTTGWRVAGENGAARLLGMPASTLQSRMKALAIKRPA